VAYVEDDNEFGQLQLQQILLGFAIEGKIFTISGFSLMRNLNCMLQ